MFRKKRQKIPLFARGLIWLWFSAVFITDVQGLTLKQRFANEPSPQTALIGSTAVLPCRVINKRGELQWTRDDFGLGNERELFAFDRYSMIGSDEEGDFSLRIYPVKLEDDAEFQCQVTAWKDIPGVRSQSAKLTVHVPPEPPKIPQGSVVQATAGQTVTLDCISERGKPAAEIQWLDSSGRVILDGVRFTKTILEDNHRFNSKSTLTLVVDRSHHNTVLTCSATNPALNQPRKTQVRLEVTFPPVVRITHDKRGYREGEDAILTCSAYANPNIVTYNWYRDGKLVSEGNQTTLVVKRVTRKDKLGDITCEASNEIATSNQITRIDVHYGPSFLEDPSDVFAEEGENVTLECQVDGSPPPKVVWISNKNSSFIYGKGSQLPVVVSKNSIGTYLCLAKVEGFPEISTSVGLFLKGPPTVTSEKRQMGSIGDVGQITCYVPFSTPNSVHVNWFKDNSPIDIRKDKYTLEKNSRNHGVVLKLSIGNLETFDFGAYNCSVQNEFGAAVAQVSLQKKDSISIMLVAVCVVVGVFFLLVAVVCFFLYKKRNAKDNKESKGDSELPVKNVKLQVTEQNSLGGDSDIKVSIDGHNGGGSSSSTNKEVIFEPTWEAKMDPINPPSYLSNASPFLYPENYNGLSSSKMNGHVTNSLTSANMTDYLGRSESCGVTATTYSNHLPGIPSVFSNLSATTFVQRPQPCAYQQNSPSNLYSVYHKDYDSGPPESVEGLRGLSSSTFSNGYAGHKVNTTSTLPLSLQLSRGARAGSPGGGSNIVTTNGHRPSTGNCTIPRLGIPSDPSHYIVSPRTQLLQGTLATHV